MDGRLHLLLIAGALAAFAAARSVVAWILIALFVALAVEPAVGWLSRKGLRRGLAVLLVFLLMLSSVVVLVATLVPMFVEQGETLVSAAPDLLERVQNTRIVEWADRRFDLIGRAQRELRQRAPQAAEPVVGLVTGFFKGVLGVVTVTALAIFMLLFGREVAEKALEWVEPSKRGRYVDLATRMRKSVGGYVAGTLLIALIGGVLTAVGLLALGVPYFLPLGVLMVFAGIVPFVGSAVGAILVVGTTFASAGTKAGASR